MKKVLSILFMICSLVSFSQTLKTKTEKISQDYGSNSPREVSNGDITYTYYTDEKGNEIRHGSFTYKYNLYQDIPFDDPWAEGKETVIVNISGKFKNGMRDGAWQLNVTEKNTHDKHKFYDRVSNLTANFSDGKPNGLWKYSATKTYLKYDRNKYRLVVDKDYVTTTVNISANFNNGLLSGSLDYKETPNSSSTNFNAKFDSSSGVLEYSKIDPNLINYKENIYYRNNVLLDDYIKNPEHYYIEEKSLDFSNSVYSYFLSTVFNWTYIGDTYGRWGYLEPKFEGGFYKIIVRKPSVLLVDIKMPYWLKNYLRYGENIDILLKTEEECLELLNMVIQLKNIIKDAKENNDLLPEDKILTDYEQYIPKLDSAEVFLINASESKKAERLKQEEEAKLLAEKIDSNNKLLKQAKENNQKIVELCIAFKKGSAADLSVLSPDRCIKCAKSYSASKNAYVYDCIMINKKQKNIWLAYSKYQTSMNFYSQGLLKNSINYMSNSNMNITLSNLNIGFNNQDVFEEIKNSTDIESANKYNEKLSTIIAIQKKLLTVLNDKKLTKTLNKELKDIETTESISKIILEL